MKQRYNLRFFLLINLFLIFVLVGVVISFFIFALERNDLNNFQARAESQEKETLTSDDDVNNAMSVQRAIRKIAKANMKAVVSIATETVIEMRHPYERFFGEEFFNEFFGDVPSRKRVERGLGSGFIVDEDGYLLSNFHVVKNASKIMIQLFGEDVEYEAEIVGTDESSDLALLKIKAKRKFPSVRLGDSDKVEMGDFAIAIGNPYGLNNTMTLGIISAKARDDIHAKHKYQRFIQVDVAINPGNSGGPLFNIKGEVVGVNSMIYSTTGGNMGIGFAIPVNLAKKVMVQLREKGRVTRGWLGVYPQDIGPELAKALGVKPYSGVYVTEVVPSSPAEIAGIKDGDIITHIEGVKIKHARELYEIVSRAEIDSTLDFKINRQGNAKSIKVIIVEKASEALEKEAKAELSDSWLGVEVSAITPLLRRKLSLRRDETGVIITSVKMYSPASEAGLRAGDIVKRIDAKLIRTLNDFVEYISKDKNRFMFLVKRGRYTLPLTVEKNEK